MVWNPESKTVLDFLTWGNSDFMYNYCKYKGPISPFDDRFACFVRQFHMEQCIFSSIKPFNSVQLKNNFKYS